MSIGAEHCPICKRPFTAEENEEWKKLEDEVQMCMSRACHDCTYQDSEPDPTDTEPDHLIPHSCGHITGYWGLFLAGKEPHAADLCPDCKPCAECEQKLSECRCFHDPFAGM